MSDKKNSAPKKSRFRTARGWVGFACVAFALAGMAFRVGIGTPSAFGIQQISAICLLGALETMAGAKGVMLHPLLLFVLVVALIALVSLLSNLSVTLRPRVKSDACLRSRGVDCHACVDARPEQLDPHSKRIPECSKCGKCVEACPAEAISIKLLK